MENYLVCSQIMEPAEICNDFSEEVRMKRAACIFEDLCLKLYPHLVSPQIYKLRKAIEKDTKKLDQGNALDTLENNNFRPYDFGSLCLLLMDCAETQIRDVAKTEEHLYDEDGRQNIKFTYTRLWGDIRHFMEAYLKHFIEKNPDKIFPRDCGPLFAAYARMGFSLDSVYNKLVEKIYEGKWEFEQMTVPELIGLIRGLAMNCHRSETIRLIAELITDIIDTKMDDNPMVPYHDLVNGLYSICNFNLAKHPVCKTLMDKINNYQRHIIGLHEFNDEGQKVKACALAMKCGYSLHPARSSMFIPGPDPFKPIIIDAIINGLFPDPVIRAQVNEKSISVVGQLSPLSPLPYDRVFDLHGIKVGLYVLDETLMTSDGTHVPNGEALFGMRLNKEVDNTIMPFPILTRDLLNFDPETNTVLGIRGDFANYFNSVIDKFVKNNINKDVCISEKLIKVLKECQIELEKRKSSNNPATTRLLDEIKFLLDIVVDLNLKQNLRPSTKIMSHLADKKEEVALYCLAKIAVAFQKIPNKEEIAAIVSPIISSIFGTIETFPEILEYERDTLQKKLRYSKNSTPAIEQDENTAKLIATNWMGKRATMDLPILKKQIPDFPLTHLKSISFELLSQNFLLQSDYSHYHDFEMTLHECYDNFNYLPMKTSRKYAYSEGRNLPEGIFPRADKNKTPDSWTKQSPDYMSDQSEVGFDARWNLIKGELNLKVISNFFYV